MKKQLHIQFEEINEAKLNEKLLRLSGETDEFMLASNCNCNCGAGNCNCNCNGGNCNCNCNCN